MSESVKLSPLELVPTTIRDLMQATLTSPGVTALELRQAVKTRAAALGGADRPMVDLPDELARYVTKVAKHAYKVTEEDIEELKGCGYSEDAIFEITLCAAVGASMARLERGLEILTHDSPSPAEE